MFMVSSFNNTFNSKAILEKLYSIHRKNGSLDGDGFASLERCPYCGSNRLVRNSEGLLVCASCGSVVEERCIVVNQPEYRPCRLVKNPEIEHYALAISGKVLPTGSHPQDRSDAYVVKSLLTNEERWLNKVVTCIDQVCTILGISLNSEHLSQLLKLAREVYNSDLNRSRSKTIASTAVAIALVWYYFGIVHCYTSIPRNLSEFVKQLMRQGYSTKPSEVLEVARWLLQKNKHVVFATREKYLQKVVDNVVEKAREIGYVPDSMVTSVRKLTLELARVVSRYPKLQSHRPETIAVAVLWIVLQFIYGRLDKNKSHLLNIRKLCMKCRTNPQTVNTIVEKILSLPITVLVYV